MVAVRRARHCRVIAVSGGEEGRGDEGRQGRAQAEAGVQQDDGRGGRLAPRRYRHRAAH